MSTSNTQRDQTRIINQVGLKLNRFTFVLATIIRALSQRLNVTKSNLIMSVLNIKLKLVCENLLIIKVTDTRVPLSKIKVVSAHLFLRINGVEKAVNKIIFNIELNDQF